LLAAVGSARHSTASSERDDLEHQEIEQKTLLLKAENARLTKERNTIFFLADELRESLNAANAHHELKTTQWASSIDSMNLKMKIAVGLIPAGLDDVKKSLTEIDLPVTEKKARLSRDYLMVKCKESFGPADQQRILAYNDDSV
jgi:hypothetical protein